MKYFIELRSERHEVELPGSGAVEAIKIDGQDIPVKFINGGAAGVYILHLDNRSFDVHLHDSVNGLNVQVNGHEAELSVWDERTDAIRRLTGNRSPEKSDVGEVRAPMPGMVVKVLASENQAVEKGQGVLVVEAMKMENVIPAPVNGIVNKCLVTEGAAVGKGDKLMIIG